MTTAPEPSTSAAPVPVSPAGAPAPATATSGATEQSPTPVAPGGAPAERRTVRGMVAAAGGSALNFLTLTARVATLTTSALYLKERMHQMIRDTEANAEKVRAVAEMCGAAGVDAQYTALISESSTALHRVADAARDVAETADRTELHARQLGDAHQAEYRGVHEAVQASGVQQPRAGFNAVR